jgi:opacity protein-like surface antigen
MQKLTLISMTLGLSLGLAGAASAQDWATDNYGQVNLGAGLAGQVELDATVPGRAGSADEDLKAGLFASALVGHAFGNGLSLEAEAYYGKNDIKTGDLDAVLGFALDARVQSYGAMANLKLEAPTPYDMGGLKVAPYVAGGVGYGGVKFRAAGASDSDGGFTWQLKAGLAIQSSDQLTWDLGYRYLTSAKYKANDGLGTSLEADTHIHALTAGVRLNF